jgi:hypothetical protein
MNTGIGARVKRIAKVLAALCAIELFLPGGTLIVVGYLLTVHRRAHASGEGEPAVGIWAGVRGRIFENTGDGGPPQADENTGLPTSSRTG